MNYSKSWLPEHETEISPVNLFQADKPSSQELQDYKAM